MMAAPRPQQPHGMKLAEMKKAAVVGRRKVAGKLEDMHQLRLLIYLSEFSAIQIHQGRDGRGRVAPCIYPNYYMKMRVTGDIDQIGNWELFI
ncbi:hypothetical protein VPH35_123179 [Triticum aestivum]